MVIEVNYDGMRELRSMAADQRGWLKDAEHHASVRCSPAPFSSGLLSLFGDQYRDAHSTVVESLAASERAGDRARDVVAASIRTYRERDLQASERMGTIERDVEQVSVGYSAPPGGGPLSVPRTSKNVGDATGQVTDPLVDAMDDRPFPRHRAGPQHRAGDPYPGGPGDVIDLFNNTVDTVNAGATGVDGLQDSDDYDDFIKEHEK